MNVAETGERRGEGEGWEKTVCDQGETMSGVQRHPSCTLRYPHDHDEEGTEGIEEREEEGMEEEMDEREDESEDERDMRDLRERIGSKEENVNHNHHVMSGQEDLHLLVHDKTLA